MPRQSKEQLETELDFAVVVVGSRDVSERTRSKGRAGILE
jgi:hypothetical protein